MMQKSLFLLDPTILEDKQIVHSILLHLCLIQPRWNTVAFLQIQQRIYMFSLHDL